MICDARLGLAALTAVASAAGVTERRDWVQDIARERQSWEESVADQRV